MRIMALQARRADDPMLEHERDCFVAALGGRVAPDLDGNDGEFRSEPSLETSELLPRLLRMIEAGRLR